MTTSEKSNVPYIPLKKMTLQDTLSTSATSVKNALTDFLRTLLSSNIYEKYTIVMCGLLSVDLLIHLVSKSYSHSIMVGVQAILCIIIILDMFSNVLVNDINYILTPSYYYDMILIIVNIITIALLIITQTYNTLVSIKWIRFQLLLHDIKYLIPTIKWIARIQHDKKIQQLQERQHTTVISGKEPSV